jgi:O-antigen/teichoic acid export membrane protein/SAM-dependent methyltransferase
MTDFKRTAKGFFWNQIGRTIEYVLVFLFAAFVARKLGAETNGIYASVLSTVSFLLIISSMGFETAIASTFPKVYKDFSSAAGAFRGMLIFRFFFSIILGIGFLLLRTTLIRLLHLPPFVFNYLLIVVFYFILRNIISLFNSSLIAFFETRLSSSISVSIRLIELVVAYFLLKSGYNLQWIFLLITTTSLIQIVFYSVAAKPLLFSKSEEKSIAPILSLGGKFWLNSILGFVLGKQADIILLGLFTVSLVEIGNYDVAFTFAQTINIGLTMGFYGISVATFSSIESVDKLKVRKYFETANHFILLALTPVFIFAAAFSKVLIPFIYSTDYTKSIPLFQFFTIVFIVSRIFAGGLAADYLQSKGETKKLLITSVISGAANIVLAIILIPVYGILGAALATCVAGLIIAGLHFYFVRQSLGITLQLGALIKILSLSIFSVFLTYFISWNLNIWHPAFLVFMYALILVMITAVLKVFSSEEIEYLLRINAGLAKLFQPFAKQTVKQTSELTDRQKWAYAWLPQSGFVVDIGCSNSALIELIPNKSEYTIGIDTDINTLNAISQQGSKLQLMHAQAESLPLKTEFADAVLLLDVLEHTQDEKMVISEVHRILKPNGLFILSVPYKGLFSFLDPQNLSHRIKTGKKNLVHKHYSNKDLRRLLFRLFEVENKHYGGLFLYPITFWASNFLKKHFSIDVSNFFRRLGDIDNDISWGKLSYNLIIKARKI